MKIILTDRISKHLADIFLVLSYRISVSAIEFLDLYIYAKAKPFEKITNFLGINSQIDDYIKIQLLKNTHFQKFVGNKGYKSSLEFRLNNASYGAKLFAVADTDARVWFRKYLNRSVNLLSSEQSLERFQTNLCKGTLSASLTQ